MTILEQLSDGARVCIVRLRSLGDCVLTTPAVALLKQARPDLEIGIAIEDRFRPVFEGNPAVSAILPASSQAVRNWHPSIALNVHGGPRSQWITLLSGAKWRAGFAHHQLAFTYNVKIGRAQDVMAVRRTVHTAEHLASAIFALGVPKQEVPPAQLFAAPPPFTGRYGVLHPFASASEKQWPPERFCELARYLDLSHMTPIFLAGEGDDASPFAAHKVFQSNLADVKALLSKSAVFIGNDSGPAHMAAAFGIPSLVLFGASNPSIWGPWRTPSEVIVAPEGLLRVSVSRVIAALERLRILEEAHA